MLFVRLLALTFLVFAFSGALTYSKFFPKSYSRVIVDNSLSMKGRIKLKPDYIRTKTKGGVCKLEGAFQSRIPTLFITDLQRINFTPFLTKRARFQNVMIKDVGMPQNAGIIGVKTGPAVVGKEGNIYVKILNNDTLQKRQLKIFIDKNLIYSGIINLVKGENSFSFPFSPEKGIHYGWVEISPDKVKFDDKRYFTYNGLSLQNIGIISDTEPRTVETALTSLGIGAYWSTEFTGTAPFFIVIKKNISGLREAVFGKKVIISIPDSVNRYSYSSVAGVLISEKNDEKLKISSIPEDNSLYKLKDYLKKIYISPSFKVENSGDIMLKNGIPFFIKLNKDIIVLNISFTDNPFVYRPLFIPFLYYVISRLSSPHLEDRIMDDKIIIKTGRKNTFFAITPEGKKIPFEEVKEKNRYEYRFDYTKTQGIYKIYKGGKIFDVVAINPDPRESSTERLENKEKKFLFSEKINADISLLFLLFSVILIAIETFIERR